MQQQQCILDLLPTDMSEIKSVLPVGSLIVTAVCLAIGCSEPPAAGDAPALVTVRDSVGTTIVESAAQAADSSSWRIGTDPFLVIGNDESRGEAYLFGRVAGAARLLGGELVVSDGQSHVSLFDSSGVFLRPIGRRGSGPGEYRRPGAILVSNDTVIVRSAYDHQPAHYFLTNGQFVRSWPGGGGNSGADGPIDVFEDGTVLSLIRVARNMRALVPEPFVPTRILSEGRLGRADADGRIFADYGQHVISQAIHVFTYAPHPLVPGRTYRQGYEDGAERYLPQLRFAARGNELLLADGSTFEVKVLARDGSLVSIIRKQYTPVPLPRAWVDSVWHQTMNLLMDPAAARRVGQVPIPEYAPALDRLIVDTEGNLWIRSYPPGQAESPQWYIFDEQGVLRHRLRSDLDPIQIGPDFVLTTVRDSLGVESVAVYPLWKQSESPTAK
jgi:hypothetical protein